MRTQLAMLLSCAAAAALAVPCESADIVNPYAATAPVVPIPQATFAYYSYTVRKDKTVPYDGELQVSLDSHFWHTDALYGGFAKSYTIEVVGFPFDAACAWHKSGCAGLPDRTLVMPAGSWDASKQGWQYSEGALSQTLLSTTPAAGFSTLHGSALQPQGMISAMFVAPKLTVYGSNRRYVPHTALRITVRLHCGISISAPVGASFSFVYDNTRGRLSSYPFSSSNSISSNPFVYDVQYRPELLHDHSQYFYDRPDSFLEPAATIDYFPFGSSWSPQTCLPKPSTPQDEFYDGVVGYSYAFAAPYTLISAPARSDLGTVVAGYRPGSNDTMSYDPTRDTGIPHRYVIDRNIDLRLINPAGKVIYNPSRASVTADNLVLPGDYIFKTIRGAYPGKAEVLNANTAANGGPYTDLRDVPVPTDLNSGGDPRDASIYTIESGGKVLLSSCVRIYDATFVVKPGGALHIGRGVRGRYKIDNQGGFVRYLNVALPPGGCSPAMHLRSAHAIEDAIASTNWSRSRSVERPS